MSARSHSTNNCSSARAPSVVSNSSAKCEKLHGEANITKQPPASQRHNSYRVAFYGTPAEKEAYRQQIRSQLKEQVKEKDESLRKQLIERVAESDAAVASDKKSKEEDNSVKQKKADYLKQFSNENKKIMEEKEKSSRETREADVELERKLLNMNPINWNMTLH